MSRMSLAALDRVRHRIPFGYWLVYDMVVFGFEFYAVTHFSPWYLISFAFLAVATFFDVIEAIVKWPRVDSARRIADEAVRTGCTYRRPDGACCVLAADHDGRHHVAL